LSTEALGLALAAAGLHALWNLLLARERDTEATVAVSLVVFVVALAPLAAATWRVEGAAVPYIVASGALELAYIALLAAAYRRFELSLVYPLARGLAPVARACFPAGAGRRPPTRGRGDRRRRRGVACVFVSEVLAQPLVRRAAEPLRLRPPSLLLQAPLPRGLARPRRPALSFDLQRLA
jgi:hypothetical protein